MNKTSKIAMKIFLAQIDKIMDEFKIVNEKGERDDRKFDERMGWQNNLYRWRNGRVAGITIQKLLEISHKFNKSLDWIVFGEEPCLALAESKPPSYDARPLAPVEADLLHEAWDTVEEVLREEKKKLPPEQKIRLLTRVYNDCAKNRIKPDTIMVKHYLWKILDQSRR